MRLINVKTLELEEFYGESMPKEYAILSHTWEAEEVSFQEWHDQDVASTKRGFVKITAACKVAAKHNLDYLWVDTNCIDKSSSAELSEAINSMFAWYRQAAVCYVYLADVPPREPQPSSREFLSHMRKSKWFTRGWTLQELIAPPKLIFYAQDWSKLAGRSALADEIAAITRIDTGFLTGKRQLQNASVATKMSWLSRRVTTRTEDMAYCMLGIFDINMPLLYGEGSKAFGRLQEEIIRVSNDHTIFCWTWTDAVPSSWVGMLAPSPETFEFSGNIVPTKSSAGNARTFSMTNAGLSITLPVVQTLSYYFGILNAKHETRYAGLRICIPIRGYLDGDENDENFVMERMAFPPSPMFVHTDWELCKPALFIRTRLDTLSPSLSEADSDFSGQFKFGFLITIDNAKTVLDDQLKQSDGLVTTDGVYLTERIRHEIKFRSYHQTTRFDAAKSLLIFNNRKYATDGAFIRVGQTEDVGCVIYLGFRFLEGENVPLRFCKVLPARVWRRWDLDYSDLMKIAQREGTINQLEGEQTGCCASTPYHVAIGDPIQVRGCGLTSIVYITTNQSRVDWVWAEHREMMNRMIFKPAQPLLEWNPVSMKRDSNISVMSQTDEATRV